MVIELDSVVAAIKSFLDSLVDTVKNILAMFGVKNDD